MNWRHAETKLRRLRRVFQQRLAGNPLAVVFDADGLDDAAMQAIAGEFNLSETVFILRDPARDLDLES